MAIAPRSTRLTSLGSPASRDTMMLGLFEELAWRWWSCPRSPEVAARDFLERRNPERVRAALADPGAWGDAFVVDMKRRIAATYGLASRFDVRTTGWSAGWNRRLLAIADPDPEEAAGRILRHVSELAKLRQSTLPE
jgi:hypothetical protein